MSTSEAELTLVIKARDLSDRVVTGFNQSLIKVADGAQRAGDRIKGAFLSVSSGITNGLGNLTENLSQGAGLGESMFMFGTYMAGQAAEAMIGGLLEKFASSSLVAALGAPLAAAGSSVGGVVAAAIPVGMAALPVLLVAALVAAIVFLVNNPEIVDKILEFAGGVVDFIIDGLAALGGMLLNLFGAAWQLVVDAVGAYISLMVDYWLQLPGRLAAVGGMIVETIIGGLVSLPGKIADIIRDAFANLRIDVGPFHITGKGITIDLPNFNDANAGKGGAGNVNKYAQGGWMGLHGPELAIVGELEPELAIPRSRLAQMPGGGRGVTIVGVSESDILEIVERGLFVKLRAAAPTSARI